MQPHSLRLPLGCGLAALAGYAALIRAHPDAGPSATWLVQHGGLSPYVPLLHPLWGCVARAAVQTSSQPALWMNLFSAVAGALGIACFVMLSSHLRFAPVGGPDTPKAIQRTGVALAAAALAMMLPITRAATRAHPASLELIWVLGLLGTAHLFARSGRTTAGLSAALLIGPAALHIQAFPVVGALAGLVWTTGLWRRRSGRLPLCATAIALGMLSLGVAIGLTMWRHRMDPMNAWRADLAWGDMLHALAAMQWRLTRLQWGGIGWLYLLLVTALPVGLAALAVRHMDPRPVHGARLGFALALALPPTLLALNLPPAPWRLMDISTTPILACLLAAGAMQGVLCYAYHALRPLRCRPERWATLVARTGTLLTLALVLAGGWRAARLTFPPDTRPLYAWAQHTIAALGDRDILITDGAGDALLHLAAHAANQRVLCLDLSARRDPERTRWLATQLPTPGLRALAYASPGAALREWMRLQPEIIDRLAVLDHPEAWSVGGAVFIPHGTLYVGARSREAADPVPLLERELAAVDAVAPGLVRLAATSGAPGRHAQRLLDAMSRHANQLGIICESLADPVRAHAAYSLALRVRPDNVCAYVNRAWLEAHRTDPVLAAAGDGFTAHRHVPVPLMIARFGHVRQPEAFRALLAWATEATPTHRSPVALEATVPIGSLLTDAQRHAAGGDHELALALAQRAARMAPGNVAAMRTLLMMQKGTPGETPDPDLLGALLARDAGDAVANFILGVQLYHSGLPDLAEAAFRRSLDRRKTPDALNNLAWILYERGEAAEALPLVQAALRLAPTRADIRHTRDAIQAIPRVAAPVNGH